MNVSVVFQNELNLGILLVILFFSAITNGALPSNFLTLEENHLVLCLTYISQKYFAPGRILVISHPSTYRDVQQELIAEIWRTTLRPVIVTVDGNIGKPDETDNIEGDESYIILIPDGDILFFHVKFLSLIKYKIPRLWNSEVRFVVAGANELSMSQQKKIFETFSTFKIYNCIIVSQEHYVIDQKYSRQINVNGVDTGMKLGVSTWFPYQSLDSCTEVSDIILLDSWVISAQGHFTKNTDLFPRKISNSVNGCPMILIYL
jgi:hypothetical protein